jgi:nitroreductase
MDIIELLYKRRSIRKYHDKPVSNETLELLLKAATCAPTAANNQPWEFVAINNEHTMDELRSGLFFGNYNAPAAIVVCANMDLAPKGPYKEYWIQDCSAATENIIIAASGLGMGTVWIGAYPNLDAVKNIRRTLSIPEEVIPLSVVYIGYAAEEREPRTQYDPKRVYWNQYDSGRKHRARQKNLKHL